MALEIIVAYGFAVSVPLWLVIEQLAHRPAGAVAAPVESPVESVVARGREPVPALRRKTA